MRLIFLFVVITVSCGAQQDIFSANLTIGSTLYSCVKIPTILLTQQGTLIALGEGRINSCEDVAETHLLIRRSFDTGATWTNPAVVYCDPGNVIGNAAPVQGSRGRIFLPFNRNNRETWMTTSDDDGASWAFPTIMPSLQKADWVWVGLGPPSGLRLSTGRLLIPGYHGTLPLSNMSSFGSSISKGHTIVSDDDGSTWRLACAEFGDPFMVNELQAAELFDGTVLFNARIIDDRRALSVSLDSGDSVVETRLATTLHQTFQGCEGSMVTDFERQRLFYSGVQGRLPFRIYREDLTLFVSEDSGSTWVKNQTIDAGSSAYSALTWLPSMKTIAVLYERANCVGSECPLIFIPDHITWKILVL